MQFNLSYALKAKVVAHIFQGVLVFIAWAITFSILVSPGGTDGRSKWYFVLCFLTAPALIYLSMTPRFEKTRKFANVYAFAAVDALFCIFWFSAFVAVAAFVASSEDRGASERKLPTTNCSTFANGSEKKCKLSKATAGLGSVVFISFIITGAISLYGLMQHRKGKGGTFLGTKSAAASDPNSMEAQTKAHTDDAFSSNLDDDGTYVDPGPEHEHDEHALLHSGDAGQGGHTGGEQRWDDRAEDHNGFGGGYDSHRPVRGDDESYYGDEGERYDEDPRPAHSPPGGRTDYPTGDYGYRGARA
ncbi:MAG: hypothetical protein M1813_004141 [Trichoglossum hirsutum]|nr:MAG: hypothetical protein M1813_004141 [Trichoglossum hirsutum]